MMLLKPSQRSLSVARRCLVSSRPALLIAGLRMRQAWHSTRSLALEEEDEEELNHHDTDFHRWRRHNGATSASSSVLLQNLPPSSSTPNLRWSRPPSFPSSHPTTSPLLSETVSPIKAGESEAEQPDQAPLESSVRESVTSERSSAPKKSPTEQTDKDKAPKEDKLLETDPFFLTYTGGNVLPMTSRLELSKAVPDPFPAVPAKEASTMPKPWPVFRIMNEDGTFRDPSLLPSLESTSTTSSDSTSDGCDSTIPVPRNDLEALRNVLTKQHPSLAEELSQTQLLHPLPASYHHADDEAIDQETAHNTLQRLYRHMIRLRTMDDLFQSAQRQGRLSFYMTCRGEEAIHMGAASALDLQDVILAQYREQGILMHRGFTLQQFANQCFSNQADLGKGRQMPIHYGSRALNYHTVSSPLGTQLPQAVGVAYRLKLLQQNETDPSRKHVAACFFGEGCASTTDFHSALNFAATLHAPVLFLCRNNGYAISTPVTDQYAGDGVVARAPGYGMAAIRVDGNDLFAVHAAVREAKAYATEHSEPVLVEFMTYRLGHHSTSDDSTRYRDKDDIKRWLNLQDPVHRMERFLQHHEWLSAEDMATIYDEERIAVLKAMEQGERKPKPPVDTLFEDVYAEVPKHLVEQRTQLEEHMKKYPKQYKA